jgi:hypothetical protein
MIRCEAEHSLSRKRTYWISLSYCWKTKRTLPHGFQYDCTMYTKVRDFGETPILVWICYSWISKTNELRTQFDQWYICFVIIVCTCAWRCFRRYMYCTFAEFDICYDICAQVYLGRLSTSLFLLSWVLCPLRVFSEMSTVQKRKVTDVVTNEALWYPEYNEFWDRAAKTWRSGLPCIVKVQNGDDQGGRITLELIPQDGWVHMSTEIGRREAPFPYHVSLCWATDADVKGDLIEITKQWDRKAHVLDIDYMSKQGGVCVCVT